MNSFEFLCQHRRSIRRYTGESVSQEDIDAIMRCALMSPSAKRINPWECVVVQDKNMLLSFAGIKKFGSSMFTTAPLAIVVVVDPSLTDTWQCDGAIFAHNITLAATDLGLGACWCHIYGRQHDTEDTNQEASSYVKKLLNIAQHKEVLCIVSIGHVDEERKPYDVNKLAFDKVHTEHF